MPPAVPAPVADAALRAQLEEEKSLTAQLQARLRSRARAGQKSDLQDKVDKLTQQLDVQGLELQRMRRTTPPCANSLKRCGRPQPAGVTEPH
jgi:hypothetical protein